MTKELNLADFESIDSGGRQPQGIPKTIFLTIAFTWSVFQLYVASSIPADISVWLGINVVLASDQIRYIHLAFALVLVALAYPLFKNSPRTQIPWYDWLLAALGAMSCLYLLFDKAGIADRAGLPTTTDLVMSAIGIMVLGIAVWRSLGLPLVIVASVFVFYVFFGHLSFLPDAIQWKGASFGKAMWHYWMQTEGVFGVAIGVSASMIFLFVLFGSLLERAGAGKYFIELAFALLGHFKGGPAKAAVFASALSGIYSGSSIANVVTTGTFTIPLMKKSGFPAEKAGAVEVASSTNGQLTPPVMGAAAFLIAEFTGISYTEIIKHAFLPAIISYIALIYIVHLEALKQGLKGMTKPTATQTWLQRMVGVLFGFIATGILFGAVYFGLGWIKTAFPNLTFYSAVLIFLVAYIVLLMCAAKRPDLPDRDPENLELPKAGEVAITGLHFVLPIVILIWSIMIERLSPSLSAFWATMAMIFVVLTQHPLKAFFRKQDIAGTFKQGIDECFEGMVNGSKNMMSIAAATAVAGIIIGSVSLTGAHQVIGEFVEFLSGGNLILMLILVALMSLILGMGLPTTANYIVVSSLMAPVIVTVGAQSGLIVPLIAVHLFVFYFGILADDTPPVGLAAFAAAAISGGDPIKTGIQGFVYDMRTALLPFLFIFNTELLLLNVTLGKAIFVFIIAVIAMLLFASATQGYFLRRNKLWESALLLLIAFTLFRPGFWLNQVQEPYVIHEPAKLESVIAQMPADSNVRMEIIGTDFDNLDEESRLTILVPLAESQAGLERLKSADLTIKPGTVAEIDEPLAGTQYFEQFKQFDFYGDSPVRVLNIQTPAERVAKEVFYLPAFLLLALIIFMQKRRQKD